MARILVASDSFTEASDTNLESHNAGNWTELTTRGAGYVKVHGTSDTLRCAFGPGQDVVYRWTGAGTFTGDQYAKATTSLFTFSGSSEHVGVMVFSSADTGANADYYALVILDNQVSGGSHGVRLRKCVNGTITDLYSASSTWTDGDTVALEAVVGGSSVTLRMYQNDVQFGGDITDSGADRLTSGLPGVSIWGTGSFGGPSLDDWEAGTLGAGGSAKLFRSTMGGGLSGLGSGGPFFQNPLQRIGRFFVPRSYNLKGA